MRDNSIKLIFLQRRYIIKVESEISFICTCIWVGNFFAISTHIYRWFMLFFRKGQHEKPWNSCFWRNVVSVVQDKSFKLVVTVARKGNY